MFKLAFIYPPALQIGQLSSSVTLQKQKSFADWLF